MERGFRDRYEPTAGSVAGTNNSTWGGSGGAGMILPFTKTLSFQASGLFGDGIGRYGSGGLPDVTVRPDGDRRGDPREPTCWLGLTFKPTSRLTLYAYGGEEQAQRASYTSASGTLYGYGNPGYNNSGCDKLTGTAATCVANTQQARAADRRGVVEGLPGRDRQLPDRPAVQLHRSQGLPGRRRRTEHQH